MATNISGGITTPTSTTHTGNNTTGPFSISFEYSIRDDVQVFVDGVLKTVTTHYTFFNSFSIAFTSGNAPANGAIILIQRNTIVASPTHTFADASVLTATDLNRNNAQIFHGVQELVDDYVKRDGSQTIKGNLVFEGSSDDDNETTLAITNPTADRTITLPDTTGTVVTTGDTGSVSSTMITDGTIVDADINASAAISGSKLQAASGSNAGSMSASDKSKLDGIEANATADQTAAEIRTLVESATDSNVFTDADHTKLNGIEASATADQTAAEIRTLVESATDSNVFTDADHTKLNGIEANATADQTDAEIRAAVEAASDSNVFTDADHTKLNGIEASADVTDATNVDAAGAIMNSDLDTKGEILVGDGAGDPTALSVGQNNYVLIADSNEASGVKWGPAPSAGGLNNIVEDTSPQLGGALDVQAQEINTSTTNGNIKLNPNGTGVVEVKGDGSSSDGTIQLNCSQNSHGVKIKSPAHSAGASYTLTLPSSIVNGAFLQTDSNGNLTFTAVNTNLVNDTSPQLGGDLQSNGNDIDFADNDKAIFGADGDLQIFHDNTNTLSEIKNSNVNNFTIRQSVTDAFMFVHADQLQLRSQSTNEPYINCIKNGSVELYHDNVKKAETTANGVDVQGQIHVLGTVPQLRLNSDTNDGSTTRASFGMATSANNFVNGSTVNDVVLNCPKDFIISHGTTDLMAAFKDDGAVELYYDNAKKIETTSAGATVTGTCSATTFSGSGASLTNIPAANITGTLPAIDGSNLTGITAGAQGGGGESIFFESENTMNNDYTISSNHNALVAGPLSIASGATLTINNPSVLTIP